MTWQEIKSYFNVEDEVVERITRDVPRKRRQVSESWGECSIPVFYIEITDFIEVEEEVHEEVVPEAAGM